MGLSERIDLYRRLEEQRKRPIIAFVTSTRTNAEGFIAGDAVHELELQLQALPSDIESLDFLIVSNGGDPTVAWRFVSLIRERVNQFSVLVPAGAFSAATLIALGANSIVMHANGNLGPIDPQIQVKRRDPKSGQESPIAFGSEDLSAFLTFARDNVGVSDQLHLSHAFSKFCDEVGAVPIGVAARSAQLSLSMAEKLLKMHMSKDGEQQLAKTIAEKLTREYYHHGYALSRSEAREIGLKVEEGNDKHDDLIWRTWLDFVDELEIRVPFHPPALVQANPACCQLFGPVPSLAIPHGLPPQMVQQVLIQLAQQSVVLIPPTNYRLVQACIESPRYVSQFITEGAVFASRQPDLRLNFNVVHYRQGWRSVEPPNNVASAEAGGVR